MCSLKTRFIVNPRSGKGAAALARLRTYAPTLDADIALTTHPRHATELAMGALSDGCGLVVAVGGDGTLNEVAAALVGTRATLGLVPCGSGDGLGRHLGIHGSLDHSLAILRTGRPRLIDTGLADGHPFFTAAGLGFEAEVAHAFNRLKTRGFLRYVRTSASLWRSYVPQDYWFDQAGERVQARAFTLVVSNCDQYGNGALIAPGARVDDGLLDLTLIPPVSVLRAMTLLPRLFTGSIGHARGVVRLQAPRLVVERRTPGLIHTDGETHSAGTLVEFIVRPRSLRVMAPASDDLELLPTDPALAASQA